MIVDAPKVLYGLERSQHFHALLVVCRGLLKETEETEQEKEGRDEGGECDKDMRFAFLLGYLSHSLPPCHHDDDTKTHICM